MRRFNRREIAAGLAGGIALSGCATSTVGPIGPFGPAPKLLYLGQAKVFRLDAASGAPVTLVDEAPKDGSRAAGVNDGIAVHSKTGQIFWSNMGKAAERDGYIKRCERDGSNLVTVVKPGGAFTPKQLKIDEAGGKLCWADREGMAMQRCNLDGSEIETIVVTGDPATNKGQAARWCVGIALDPMRGQVYWTQKGGDNAGEGTIRRCGLRMPAGATAQNRRDIETLFSHLPEPIDIDLDLKGRQMYWSDRGDNTISRATMDPKADYDPATRFDRTILVKGLKEAIGIALDLPRKRMAYTSLGGEVGSASLDGAGARMLATGQGMLTGICWG
jgi:hypothetical protein